MTPIHEDVLLAWRQIVANLVHKSIIVYKRIRVKEIPYSAGYHASNSSSEFAERKATGAALGSGKSPAHWMDSGPLALATSSACSASRRTTTGERSMLVAMPKQAERRTASPFTRKGAA